MIRKTLIVLTRPTVIGGCFGGAIGALIYLHWPFGRIFVLFTLPGSMPVFWLRGIAQMPSVETLTLQIMAYSVVGAQIGWLFGYYITPLYHRRRKRKKLGLYQTCGYDLRASKERCPECGSTI